MNTKQMTPHDSKQVMRLVGFMEYGSALANLDSLIRMSDEEEMAAYDEIVRERDEFAVYTNLARKLEPALGSSLQEPPQYAADSFERRGLAWMTALARVELGAMLAAFTDAKHPFASTQPSEFDMQPFQEILVDGVRVHYWSLRKDPALVTAATRMSPGNPAVLSYARRLVLARTMLRAAGKAAQGRFSPQQATELAKWYDELNTAQGKIVARIEAYMEPTYGQTSSSSTSQRSFTGACGAMLRAEQRERRNGTAVESTFRY